MIRRMLFVAVALAIGTGAMAQTPAAPSGPLTLQGAINLALEHNVQVITSEQRIDGARGARWRALEGLLPTADGRIVTTRQTTNLAAFGFDASLFPGIPAVVGPFNVFDARVAVSQPILDLSALHDVRRARHLLVAARLTRDDVRDFVTLATTSAYLQAAAGAKRIEAVRTQVQTAESLLKLANGLHDAGAAPGIDAVRARSQVATQRQRLISAENDFAKQKLQLARVIGAAVAQQITLADPATEISATTETVEAAVAHAKAARADYQALLARVHAAEEEQLAAKTEALPSLHANADIGAIGPNAGDARRTYALSGAVRVPLFNSARRAHAIEAASALRERQAEATEMAQQVESEVRMAFLDVQAAVEQLGVAKGLIDLANQELALARTRFSNGVTSNLEVIQAQAQVAVATENEIASSYALNLARATLARAIGSGPATN